LQRFLCCAAQIPVLFRLIVLNTAVRFSGLQRRFTDGAKGADPRVAVV